MSFETINAFILNFINNIEDNEDILLAWKEEMPTFKALFPTKKASSKKAKDDTNKKPKTAYQLFCEKFRPQVKSENPEADARTITSADVAARNHVVCHDMQVPTTAPTSEPTTAPTTQPTTTPTTEPTTVGVVMSSLVRV